MSHPSEVSEAASGAPGTAGSAMPGALLRAERERAGLGIDDIARQLRLAPRQIEALEADDYAQLPGITFVRGFVRNYARLLKLDAEPLLERLRPSSPEAELQPIGRTIGALPQAEAAGSHWQRWMIPLLLVLVLVAGAAYYEWTRRAVEISRAPATIPLSVEPVAPEKGLAPPSEATAPLGPASPPDATAPAGPGAPAGSAEAGSPAAGAIAPAAPGAGSVAPAPPPPAVDGGASATSANAAAPAPGEVTLQFAFAREAWVEVRDARGEVLMSRTSPAGSTREVVGRPPLSLVIGNASAVRLTMDGRAVDLVPHSERDIARLRLP